MHRACADYCTNQFRQIQSIMDLFLIRPLQASSIVTLFTAHRYGTVLCSV